MDGRIKKIRENFNQNKIEALLISNFYNIFYLTGFETLTKDEREAFVLVTKESTYLFTDARYITEELKIVFEKEKITLKLLEPGKGLFFYLQEIFTKEQTKTLGIEGEDLRVREHMIMQKIFPMVSIVATERLIIKIREVKNDEEIEKITKACEITDLCLKNIIPIIKVGMTEKEIASKFEYWLKENSADIAFDPIVAVNKNSSIPHYNTKTGNGFIEKRSVILIDYGAKFSNYLSDITRMIFVDPDQEMENVYNQLLKIQEQTVMFTQISKTPIEIDAFCRENIGKNNLPNFSHSVGHGVGLEIHEYPKISQTSQDVINNNQVFTIEPGIYIEGKWGMRIEDTVVIKNGKAEILTKFDKKFITL